MSDERARMKAALCRWRADDEPPSDWADQLLARVPAPIPQRPSLRETVLWLGAWALLLVLALLLVDRFVDAEALRHASLAVHPWLPVLLLVVVSQALPHARLWRRRNSQ